MQHDVLAIRPKFVTDAYLQERGKKTLLLKFEKMSETNYSSINQMKFMFDKYSARRGARRNKKNLCSQAF